MSWYAVGAIDDAVDATRSFLFPFDVGRWARLAVIVFFLGGAGGGTGNIMNADGGVGPAPGGRADVGLDDVPLDMSLPDPSLLLALAGVVFLVGLLFGLVSSVMQFVFVDVIRTDEVRVWGPFRRRFGKGVRLFGFTLAVLFLVFGPVTALVGFVVLSGSGVTLPEVGAVVALGLVTVVVGVPLRIIIGFTNTFVVPVMIVDDVGVLAGWRRFWPTLRAEWKEFVVYLVARVLLGIGVGIAVAFVFGTLLVVVVIVVLMLGGVVVAAFGGLGAALEATTGVVVIVTVALLTVLLLLVIVLSIRVVTATYFRTYELLVLAAANDVYDLLPGRLRSGDRGAGGIGGISRDVTADEDDRDDSATDSGPDDEHDDFRFTGTLGPDGRSSPHSLSEI